MKADAATGNVNVLPARRLKLPVLDRRHAGREFVWLTLEAPADWRSLPGQFVNVLCMPDEHAPAATDGRVLDGESVWPRTEGLELAQPGPIVRRPYSISRIRREGDRVRLILLVQRRARARDSYRSSRSALRWTSSGRWALTLRRRRTSGYACS